MATRNPCYSCRTAAGKCKVHRSCQAAEVAQTWLTFFSFSTTIWCGEMKQWRNCSSCADSDTSVYMFKRRKLLYCSCMWTLIFLFWPYTHTLMCALFHAPLCVYVTLCRLATWWLVRMASCPLQQSPVWSARWRQWVALFLQPATTQEAPMEILALSTTSQVEVSRDWIVCPV